MIHLKSDVREIVIARFTHEPSAELIKSSWLEAKRCKEIDKRFPFDMVSVSVVSRGFEVTARMK